VKHGSPKTPYAKKSFGQNFLTDRNYVERIVDALDVDENDTVFEIGPGRGALTERLVGRAAAVIAIELDRDMIAILRGRFDKTLTFHLVDKDALQIDFFDLAASLPETYLPAKLVANLPYYISTAILQRLIEQRKAFSEIVLMFQREVAERITARPGSAERGFLTAMVEATFEVERLFDVPPTAFRPVPKVWSSVVRLTPTADVRCDAELLRRIASAAFSQKRKTIFNNLRAVIPDAARLLESAGIDPKRRAETLTGEEWTRLTLAHG
jgi:16S rRNA (adenine1518-N6/adenine1519-N6)-dimethyltransferase